MIFTDSSVCMFIYLTSCWNWGIFAIGTVNQISTTLGIRCFVINPVKKVDEVEKIEKETLLAKSCVKNSPKKK